MSTITMTEKDLQDIIQKAVASAVVSTESTSKKQGKKPAKVDAFMHAPGLEGLAWQDPKIVPVPEHTPLEKTGIVGCVIGTREGKPIYALVHPTDARAVARNKNALKYHCAARWDGDVKQWYTSNLPSKMSTINAKMYTKIYNQQH